VAPSATTAAAISGEGVFTARIMAGIADVASSVARLIAVEVVELLLAATRQGTVVPVVRIVAVVDMAVETGMAVEPGAGSDEHSADIPIGPIVAVGSAVVGRIVEIAVGAAGGRADVDADGNLGRGV
jgi:hypothetical protein